MVKFSICIFCVGTTLALWPAFPSRLSGGIPLGESPFYNPEQKRTTRSYALQGESERESVISQSVPSCFCESDINVLETRLRSEHSLMERVQNKIDDLSNIVYNLRATVDKLEQPVNAEQAFGPSFGNPRHVSFAANVRNNKAFLGPTDTIVFDNVIVNDGQAYDPFTGIFTAPVQGVYHLSATILSGFNATIETMITLNGEDVARMFSGAYLSRGSGSNNILINLKEGDEVSVNVFYGNGNYVHGVWSTFMGYLINRP